VGLLVVSTRIIPGSIVEAVEKLYEAGLDLLDINYASIERTMIDFPSVPNVMRHALLRAVELGASPITVHAPWEDYFLIHLGRGIDYAVAEAKIFLEIAGAYGARVVVFHGFSARRVGSYRAEWVNKRFFSSLADYAEREDLPIVAVENSSGSKPLNRIEAVKKLVAEIDSPKLRPCIDIGHAYVNGYGILKADKAIEPLEPVCIHVHDNNGRRDEHLHIGCGSINWLEAARAKTLAGSEYVVLEADCTANDVYTCVGQARIEANNARSVLKEWLS